MAPGRGTVGVTCGASSGFGTESTVCAVVTTVEVTGQTQEAIDVHNVRRKMRCVSMWNCGHAGQHVSVSLVPKQAPVSSWDARV